MHGHILAWMRYKGILKNRNINFIIFDWQAKRHKNINKRIHNMDLFYENCFTSSLFHSNPTAVAIWPILCKWTKWIAEWLKWQTTKMFSPLDYNLGSEKHPYSGDFFREKADTYNLDFTVFPLG